MKETQQAGVRPYLHAIYQNNRLRFAVTLAGYLLFGLTDTAFAILQGEFLNVMVQGSLTRLGVLAVLLAGLLAVQFAAASATYYLKCRFVHQGIAQYKSFLFRRLCKLSQDDLELLTLLMVDGYRQVDIARIKGCSRNVISKRLKKIKKILLEG